MSISAAQTPSQDRIGRGARVVTIVGAGAALAAATASLTDLVWFTRPLALLGMVGGVGALVCATRSSGTGRKGVFALLGVALLIAGSTIFGMSFPH